MQGRWSRQPGPRNAPTHFASTASASDSLQKTVVENEDWPVHISSIDICEDTASFILFFFLLLFPTLSLSHTYKHALKLLILSIDMFIPAHTGSETAKWLRRPSISSRISYHPDTGLLEMVRGSIYGH